MSLWSRVKIIKLGSDDMFMILHKNNQTGVRSHLSVVLRKNIQTGVRLYLSVVLHKNSQTEVRSVSMVFHNNNNNNKNKSNI